MKVNNRAREKYLHTRKRHLGRTEYVNPGTHPDPGTTCRLKNLQSTLNGSKHILFMYNKTKLFKRNAISNQ